MAEGAAHATKPVPGAVVRAPAARQAPAQAMGARRVFSEPGQAAERSVGAYSPRAMIRGAFGDGGRVTSRGFLSRSEDSRVLERTGKAKRSGEPARPVGAAGGEKVSSARGGGGSVGSLTEVPGWAAEDSGAPGSEALESQREDGGEPGSAGWQQKVSGVFDVVGRGGGHPLAPGVRDDMERRLSADFSDVRIHTDARAAESAEMVSAEAYTVGNEIVFGTGSFDPHSSAGKARLAHELSHVLQQRRGPVSGTDTGGGVLVSGPSDSFEQEARTIASRVVPGARPAAGSGARPDGEAARVVGQRAGQLALQRQPKTSPERPSPSAPVTSATRSRDEGGAANVTTLEQDMGRILDQWEIAALEGVTQFVTNALSERLDAIESGSWESYIVGLVGNTLWAATAFFPPGMALAVFALSMEGILVAATPTVPRKSKSAIPEVTRLATDYINGVYKGLDGQRREKAAALLKLDPDATRYRAMAAMIRNSFARGTYDIDPTYVKIPMINQNAVRDALVDFATERLDLVAHVGEEWSHTHDYRGDTWTESSIVEVAWVQGSPQYPPRLATLNAQSTEGARTWTFRSWISPANKEAAIQQWLSKRKGPPATYQAWLIRGLSG